MVLLAVVGAVVITAALAYFTLGFISLMMLSDESLWNTIKWNWQGIVMYLIPIVLGWIFWWVFVGSKITISIGIS